ncbi:3-oxoacyl-ACP synthase [Rhodococcus sp. WS4]|nr:3-oxoacyl-ACP synthase [Rhodococcus sp. WS4]
MKTVSLIDVSSYLPDKRVPAEYFARYAETDRLSKSVMFKPPPFRHHVDIEDTAAEMIERAAAPLIERHGAQAIRDVDVLITHAQVPDMPFLGCGGDVADRLGARPEWLIDLHNGGCAVFIYMLKLASQILATTDARTALICTAANAAGTIYDQSDVRTKPHAPVPGDGCGVGFLAADDSSPILGTECRHYPEHAGDVSLTGDGEPRKYWQPGMTQGHMGFDEHKAITIFSRGNRLVPEVAGALCERLDLNSAAADTFITNQPNRAFLRNWRDALQIDKQRHPDTFDECGNMFGAAIPVTLDQAIRTGTIADGSLLLLAGFAHAGDFAAAAAVRWHGDR